MMQAQQVSQNQQVSSDTTKDIAQAIAALLGVGIVSVTIIAIHVTNKGYDV